MYCKSSPSPSTLRVAGSSVFLASQQTDLEIHVCYTPTGPVDVVYAQAFFWRTPYPSSHITLKRRNRSRRLPVAGPTQSFEHPVANWHSSVNRAHSIGSELPPFGVHISQSSRIEPPTPPEGTIHCAVHLMLRSQQDVASCCVASASRYLEHTTYTLSCRRQPRRSRGCVAETLTPRAVGHNRQLQMGHLMAGSVSCLSVEQPPRSDNITVLGYCYVP